jgi:hypothetical protein
MSYLGYRMALAMDPINRILTPHNSRPILWCESCWKPVTHVFNRIARVAYDADRSDSIGTFDYRFRCLECGEDRRYGLIRP